MAIEKKRPRGLKSSAASNKKSKTEVDQKDIHENAQTVVIDKVVEEGDDVGEAAAIFEDALGKLGNKKKKYDNGHTMTQYCFSFIYFVNI